MLQVVINWIYYKKDSWFNSWFNARLKKDMVYFYDYDRYIEEIINRLSYAELQRLRINIYNTYHDLIKFTNFKEYDINGHIIEWVKIESPIIDVSVDDFAYLLSNKDIRKKYFDYDDIRERYFLKSDFINYCQLNVI